VVTEGIVDVAGAQIRYREAGSGDAVVLVHGWPVDSRLWTEQIARLAGRHRVLALDLPGYGRSDPPAAPGFEPLVNAVLGFLDALGLERAALVGHDAGGPAVLLTAIRHPQRVSKLVVMDTTPYPKTPWLIRLLMLAGKIPGAGSLLLSRFGFRVLFRLGTAGRHVDTRAMADRFRPDPAERRRALIEALRGFDPGELVEVEAGVGSIAAPTMILWAADDPTGPLSLARRLAGDIPGSTLVTVPSCGHFLPLDRPGEVGELLAAFLD
jgi:pimeloyl-ACP methyl ester carboxylesterase